MAGIYISGMEMPKRGHTVTITIRGDSSVMIDYYDGRPREEIETSFMAIPVPDHGRLCDLDEIEKQLLKEIDVLREEYYEDHDPYDGAKGDGLIAARRMVANAITIIQADKEAEG